MDFTGALLSNFEASMSSWMNDLTASIQTTMNNALTDYYKSLTNLVDANTKSVLSQYQGAIGSQGLTFPNTGAVPTTIGSSRISSLLPNYRINRHTKLENN